MTDQKREYWSNLIAEQEASGQTIRAFCQEQGVGDNSFYYWRKKLQKSTGAVRSSENGGQRGAVGIDSGQWRATPDRERCGRGDVSPGAGRGKAMIHPPASVRVYLCLSPCDMRRSFDGLHALVRDHLQLDPFAGHLYLFANKRRDRLKILYWDRDGFAIWAKRLEAGTYAIPCGEPGSRRFEISVEELGALLSGINLSNATRRKRYRHTNA